MPGARPVPGAEGTELGGGEGHGVERGAFVHVAATVIDHAEQLEPAGQPPVVEPGQDQVLTVRCRARDGWLGLLVALGLELAAAVDFGIAALLPGPHQAGVAIDGDVVLDFELGGDAVDGAPADPALSPSPQPARHGRTISIGSDVYIES